MALSFIEIGKNIEIRGVGENVWELEFGKLSVWSILAVQVDMSTWKSDIHSEAQLVLEM